ncbi:MAG: glucosaminidase domain-containing protein [Prevotellaceae bacterium]|jgi:LysM repeat protein|nr:glucosaminidase domain-containing protein [Prevotellaceae bacterium]
MNKRYIFISIFCLFLSQAFVAQTKKTQVNVDYIEKYSEIAVGKMKQHGIPASITLAQGILESGAGNSELAQISNNHFGIKCHEWEGERVYHDDDKKGDCFRKYAKPEDSFEDHSQFLKRPRYASLYELDATDYRAWAHGLKKCGYATDPNYAHRLINIIETYELHAYDSQIEAGKVTGGKDKAETDAKPEYLPESKMGNIPAFPIHPVKEVNGKKAVIAKAGDTYESIAREFGLRKWEIRWYNKVKKGAVPEEGQAVFIRKF